MELKTPKNKRTTGAHGFPRALPWALMNRSYRAPDPRHTLREVGEIRSASSTPVQLRTCVEQRELRPGLS